jgi:hypothetical protein
MAGVVVGHTVTYLVVLPHPHEREAVLRQTGHGYFSVLAMVAVLAGLFALGGVFLRGLIAGGPVRRRPVSLFARLACVQIVAFAGMEVTERLVTGAAVSELVRDQIIVGLLVQVLIAWLGARLIQGVRCAADRVRTAPASAPRQPTVVRLVRTGADRVVQPFLPRGSARAPPRLSFAVS